MRKDWDKLPEEIREHGLDFHWDNQKVWALDLPVEELDVAEIEWMLDLPFWWRDDAGNTISPREVMGNPSLHPEHMDRVAKADTSYPLDIMQNSHGKWLTLDGLHRLIRAMERGETKVRVRKVPREMTSAIQK